MRKLIVLFGLFFSFLYAISQPVIDLRMDECKWDNNPNTYEINNSGNSGNTYNATALNGANTTEGKICRGGDINSTSTEDKAVLLKDNYKLVKKYTLNVWIKFPLNTQGHKDFEVCTNYFFGICLEYNIVNYFNIADRVGSKYDFIYFTEEKSWFSDSWTLNVDDDNGGDSINFNPQNLNGWHMLTFKITNKNTKFYLDGKYYDKFNTHPNTGYLGLIFNSDYGSNTDNEPNGQSIGTDVDEFEIYNTTLRKRNIRIIYNNEKSGKNYDGSERICPSCGGTQEINGTFNAVDYVSGQCNALNDWDDNITTKIVNKDFNLTVLAKDKDLNVPLEANITKVDFYEYNSNDCSGNYNIENICTNCGQTSPTGCLGISDVKVNKAVKCIKVHIEGNVTNPLNPIQESNATDNFAVRPESFEITNIPSNIKAGDEFNLTLKALDVNGNPSKDYNESVNINGASPDLEYNISKNNCDNGNLELVSGGSFKDGIATVILKYSEVGDVNLTLKEVNGSEFSIADNDDTSDNDRLIVPAEAKISVSPDHFDINASIQNYDKNFTYLDNDLNLYSILDINITAKNKDNKTTTNYNKDCYAKDIDINISKNLAPIPNLDKIKYYYIDAKDNKSNIFSQDINKTVQIHYKDTNFTTDNNGSTKKRLIINFDRNSSNAVNPFDMNISEINLTDKQANGNTQNIGKVLYYYGNLVLFDEKVTSDEFDTRKDYFIVYDNNESDDKLPSNNEILPDWYVNSYHNTIDGNISNSDIVVSSDYNASNQINGVEVSVNSIQNGKITFHIKRTNSSVNFAVVHLLEPNLKWLWYSRYGNDYNISPNSTCLNHFCFSITWENGEKGVIKSGETKGTESNTTKVNETKRGVKIFR
ncbi:hypothetical protein [Lebetimonas sp. JH369]|uniref:hypothetical protein n=1 Tax=Lebetimonas sp. JH369 TaxID=990069 RepID=UPI0004676DA5|nr:hypothetical protein [Lebetimonas sp. JH369]